MATERVSIETVDWTPGSALHGPQATHDGEEFAHYKILSDRRAEGGGIAFIARYRPPPGKAIKIVATARSDEHVFTLEGGSGTKSGRPLRLPGDYALNSTGQAHGAFISVETVTLVVYAGEPDEITSIGVVDIA